MTARKHHYVPQCYLKGFVADRKRPRLYVTARSGKSFLANPADVASERDFHRINADGFAPDALENAFSGFETELSDALVRSIAARAIDDEAMNYFLNFIALISVKNPRHRESFRDFQARVSQSVLSLALSSRERWEDQIARARRDGAISADNEVDYDRVKDFFEKGDYTIEVPTDSHLKFELEVFDDILQIIGARNWSLYRADPQKTGFVTTDHPSVLIWSQSQGKNIFPPGLGLGGTTLLFPLSNDMMMVGSFEDKSFAKDLNSVQVAALNSIIIAYAERQVFSRDNNFYYLVGNAMKSGATLCTEPTFIRKAPVHNNKTTTS